MNMLNWKIYPYCILHYSHILVSNVDYLFMYLFFVLVFMKNVPVPRADYEPPEDKFCI
jgi:hypothetical protein